MGTGLIKKFNQVTLWEYLLVKPVVQHKHNPLRCDCFFALSLLLCIYKLQRIDVLAWSFNFYVSKGVLDFTRNSDPETAYIYIYIT